MSYAGHVKVIMSYAGHFQHNRYDAMKFQGNAMTFGERLKELRERAGLSQAAVWEAAGLPRKTYLNYEQGVVAERIPFTAVLAIAKVLGVDCTAFADCEYTSVAEPQVEEPEAKSPDARPMGKRK